MNTTRKKMRGGGPVDEVALQNAIKNTAETLAVLKSMATPASSASASDAVTPNASVVPAVTSTDTPVALAPDAPASVTSEAPAHTSDAPVVTSSASEAPASVVTSTDTTVAPVVTSDTTVAPVVTSTVAPVVTSTTESSASETPETPKPARFTVVTQKMGTGFRLNLDNDSVFNNLKFAQQMTTIKFNVKNLQTTNPNDPIKSLLVNNSLSAADVAKILNTYLDSNPETSPTVFTLPISTGGTKKRKMMRRRMRTKRRNTMKKRNRSH